MTEAVQKHIKNMNLKKIKRVILPQTITMGSSELKQPLPLASLEQIDPFLLIHHIDKRHQVAGAKPVLDVGPHPHRGFEPISFIFEGQLHHKDSRGNDSIIHGGGVQWMTAGMGIVHSEMLPKKFVEEGGDFEMIQLWINLPKKFKMVQPNYQGFDKDDIPTIELANGNAQLNVVAGKWDQVNGPVDSLTNITAYTVSLDQDAHIEMDFPPEKSVLIYQLKGKNRINDLYVADTKLVVFDYQGEHIKIEALETGTLLVLAGNPINEPVVSWGPYVMNTQTEIMEAMRDYQMGKMGILV